MQYKSQQIHYLINRFDTVELLNKKFVIESEIVDEFYESEHYTFDPKTEKWKKKNEQFEKN